MKAKIEKISFMYVFQICEIRLDATCNKMDIYIIAFYN